MKVQNLHRLFAAAYMPDQRGLNMQHTTFATTTAETSATAFKGVTAARLKTLNDVLYDLVAGAQLHGRADMSLRELQAAYEARHNKRIELGTVSGAVTRMVDAGRLSRRLSPRPCTVTEREIMPFFAVHTQESFL